MSRTSLQTSNGRQQVLAAMGAARWPTDGRQQQLVKDSGPLTRIFERYDYVHRAMRFVRVCCGFVLSPQRSRGLWDRSPEPSSPWRITCQIIYHVRLQPACESSVHARTSLLTGQIVPAGAGSACLSFLKHCPENLRISIYCCACLNCNSALWIRKFLITVFACCTWNCPAALGSVVWILQLQACPRSEDRALTFNDLAKSKLKSQPRRVQLIWPRYQLMRCCPTPIVRQVKMSLLDQAQKKDFLCIWTVSCYNQLLGRKK